MKIISIFEDLSISSHLHSYFLNAFSRYSEKSAVSFYSTKLEGLESIFRAYLI